MRPAREGRFRFRGLPHRVPLPVLAAVHRPEVLAVHRHRVRSRRHPHRPFDHSHEPESIVAHGEYKS